MKVITISLELVNFLNVKIDKSDCKVIVNN